MADVDPAAVERALRDIQDSLATLAARACQVCDSNTEVLKEMCATLEKQERMPDAHVQTLLERVRNISKDERDLLMTVLQQCGRVGQVAKAAKSGTDQSTEMFEKVQAKGRESQGLANKAFMLLNLETKTDRSALFGLIQETNCFKNWKWIIVAVRARNRTEEATYRDDEWGVSPLRKAASMRAPYSAIHAIWEAYPAAITIPDKRGFTALLPASTDECSDEVFRFVLERSKTPSAATLEEIFEDAGLPSLTHAVIKEVIVPYLGNPLLQRSTKEDRTQYGAGTSVLHHMVCHGESPLERVKEFVSVAPETLSMVANNGDTPLHRACRDNGSFHSFAPVNVLRFLAESFPQAKSMRNKDGLTPLQMTIRYHETERISILSPDV